MRAIVVKRHGGTEVLEETEVAEPATGPADAVVRVRAVALNRLDLWVRNGVPGHTFPLPMIPGSEVSGVIEGLPPGTEDWAIGDEVIVAPGYSCGTCRACLGGNDALCNHFGIFGESSNGGYAERMAVPLRNLLRKPEALTFEEAAAIPLDFLTAWHMLLSRAGMRMGETVLVQAGGSGLGSAAIQIARLFGAKVFTTVGSPEKGEKARQLGASEVILYREVDLAKEARRLTQKKGVDIVIEHVGGETFEASLRALARGGRLVTCGASANGEARLNLRLVFFKGLSILGSTMGSLAELHEIMDHVQAGRLQPVVDRVFSLQEVAAAQEYLESRQNFGKVVLRVSDH
ncbi:MAG TPA: zinc-binding dehydrogenase [Thermoanaerobaculia bacterium]|nr:zinc-binding dehydrogenase [Thermoanaerobaculia bacterium]